MTTTLVRYAVQADDTVQDIAQAQMGDRTRWLDIVALNQLRRPYISADLADQFGPLLGTFALQSPLAAGATQISGWDVALSGYAASATLLATGNIVLVTTPAASGDVAYDAAQIGAVQMGTDPSTGHPTLAFALTPLADYRSLTGTMTINPQGLGAYAVGTTVQVYGDPTRLSTAVARIGDYLTLPVPTEDQQGNVADPSAQAVIDALGRDAALDVTGQKSVGPDGDVATVAGTQNVAQALRIRINTVPGELTQHPDFGCDIQFYLGARQDAYWPSLAQALIHDCILSDPRVHDVTAMSFTQAGDADLIDATVQLAEGGQIVLAGVPVPPA